MITKGNLIKYDLLETVLSEILLMVAAICAGFSGVIITRNLFRSSPLHTKERNRFKEYISEVEKDNKKLRGKLNQQKQKLSISEFDEANPLGAISELLGGVEHLLPPSVRPFLHNKAVLEGAEKLVKENPEVISNFLSKLVKKDGKNTPTNSDNDIISV